MSEKVSQIRQTEEDALSIRHIESPTQASLAENPSLALRLRLYRRLIPFPAALALLVFFRPNFSDNPSVGTLIMSDITSNDINVKYSCIYLSVNCSTSWKLFAM